MTPFLQRALITGGAGFIGSHLVDALVALNVKDVVVLDNFSTGRRSNLELSMQKIDLVEGDIRDRDTLLRAAEGCDTIFHLAAVVSVPQTVKDPVGTAMVNDLGTLNVLEAARRLNIKRIVLSSSSAVYGDSPEIPKSESLAPLPMSPYAAQKLAGEVNAQVYHTLFGIETVCLRYFNVFGPRQDPSSPYSGVISIFMSKAAEGKTPVIYGDGSQIRDFIFVSDVVGANIAAVSKKNIAGEVFNIGRGRYVSILELWRKIGSIANIDISPHFAPARLGDITKSVSSIDKANSMLQFVPQISLEEGLKQTYTWYRQN